MDGDGDDDHDDDLHEAVMTCTNTYYALEDRRPVYSNFFHSCISRWPAYSTAGGRPYSCKAVTGDRHVYSNMSAGWLATTQYNDDDTHFAIYHNPHMWHGRPCLHTLHGGI